MNQASLLSKSAAFVSTRAGLCALAIAVMTAGCGGGAPRGAGGATPVTKEKAPGHRGLDDRISASGGADKRITADEVLRLYIEATGGRAAYERLTSRVSKGTFSLPANGLQGPLEVYQLAPTSSYSKVVIAGVGTIENGTNGTVVWERSAMTGARVLTGQERASTLLKATFNGELKWKQIYKSVEMAGTESVNGSDAYKLLFTSPSGETETRYYDKESRLLVKSEGMVKHQMGTMKTTAIYSDYQQVDGIHIAHKMITSIMSMKQVITLSEVKHNVSMPASLFAVPADIQKLLDKK